MDREKRKEKKLGLETLVNIRKIERFWKEARERMGKSELLKRAAERFKGILYGIGGTTVISSLMFAEKAAAQQPQPPQDAHALLTLLTVGGLISLIGGAAMYVYRFITGGAFPPAPAPPPIPAPPPGLAAAIAGLPAPPAGVNIPQDYLIVRDRLQRMNPSNFRNTQQFIEFVRETRQLIESILQGPGARRAQIPAGAENFLMAANAQLELIARGLSLYDAQIEDYKRALEQTRREGIWLRREYTDWARRLTILGLIALLLSYGAPPLWNLISRIARNTATLLGLPVRAAQIETATAVEEATRGIKVERAQVEATAELLAAKKLAFQKALEELKGKISSIEKDQVRGKMELIKDLQGILYQSFELMREIAESKLSDKDKQYLMGQIKQNIADAQRLIGKFLTQK